MLGLFAGKPIGILLFSWIAVRVGAGRLQHELTFKHLLGAGILGGIGFTMSVFITLLAFNNDKLIAVSKISILLASMLSAAIGLLILSLIKPVNDRVD